MSDNPLAMKEAMGVRIARLRDLRDMTQEELGAVLGVSKSQVSQWENGKRAVSTRYLPELAAALTVPVDALFDDAGKRALAHYFRMIAGTLEAQGLTSGAGDAAGRSRNDRGGSEPGRGTG